MVTCVLANKSRKYAIDIDYGVGNLCEVRKKGGAEYVGWTKGWGSCR